jgi:hypothetical protein
VPRFNSSAVVQLTVVTVVGAVVTVLANLYTDGLAFPLGIVFLFAVGIQVAVLLVVEYASTNEARIRDRDLLATLKLMFPFSRRLYSRLDALRLARRDIEARREVRLRAIVPPDRLAEVLAWMNVSGDAVCDVPSGCLRVLVGSMGSGKTEQAMRWIEQGIVIADSDPDFEIPI